MESCQASLMDFVGNQGTGNQGPLARCEILQPILCGLHYLISANVNKTGTLAHLVASVWWTDMWLSYMEALFKWHSKSNSLNICTCQSQQESPVEYKECLHLACGIQDEFTQWKKGFSSHIVCECNINIRVREEWSFCVGVKMVESPELSKAALCQKGKRVGCILRVLFQCLRGTIGTFLTSFKMTLDWVPCHVYCRTEAIQLM